VSSWVTPGFRVDGERCHRLNVNLSTNAARLSAFAAGGAFRDSPAHFIYVEFWDTAQRLNTLTSFFSTRRRNCNLHIALRIGTLD
jgi:hypothetical protein